MPLYEYACRSCGDFVEVLRPMSRLDDPVTCATCGQEAIRVLSVFASFSKGSEGEVAPIAGGGGCACAAGGACGCSLN